MNLLKNKLNKTQHELGKAQQTIMKQNIEIKSLETRYQNI